MKYWPIVAFGLILIIGFILSPNRSLSGNNIHPVKFFDQGYFDKGISQINPSSLPPIEPIAGGILPHDIFPSFIPARFMYYLSKNPPQTVIILGPNHYEKGSAKVLTSLYSWRTVNGVLAPDIEIINKILKNNLIKVDETVLPNDHADISMMPYLVYFMPKTKVVPLLLSSRLTLDDLRSLTETIKPLLSDQTVVIAAVDFSHYLSSPMAKSKDQETLQLIKVRDYRQLLTLGNDHLDSPASIILLLQLMSDQKPLLIDHTNSGQIQNNDNIETTSYFSLVFPRK